MTYMRDEIGQQPEVARQVVRNLVSKIDSLVDEIHRRGITFVYIAARGSSDHAAVYCKYVLEIQNGIPVALATPSAFTLYDRAPRFNRGCLVIGISQSGAGPDVIEVVRQARESGALTACIVNEPESILESVSEYPILVGAGKEKSVAATKTYTGTLAVIALLSVRLSGGKPAEMLLLDQTFNTMEQTLEVEQQIMDAAERSATISQCIVLARGFNQATALEASLKLIETCYIGARAYSGADFQHGPVAQVEKTLPCLLFAPSGKTLPSMIGLGASLRQQSDHLVCFSDSREMLSLGTIAVSLPKVEDWLSPLAYIIPAQLFANALALLRGLDPDRPRGLNKVTQTV